MSKNRQANTGMPPPALIREGEASTLQVAGIPLGLLEVTSYEEQTVELCAGDLLCFYSDGINDILNAEGEFFGERRIEDLLVRHQGRSVQEILSEIF